MVPMIVGCASEPQQQSASQADAAALHSRIERCLQQTGGKLPTLYDSHPLDVPSVRDTPEACRGIELQVQEAVHQRTLKVCDEASSLLSGDPRHLSAETRQTAEGQLRRCAEGDPDIFYW